MSKHHVQSRLRRPGRGLRRHERMIADVIATHPSDADRFTLASLFSSTLRKDNKRFNLDSFMEASRISPWWQSW